MPFNPGLLNNGNPPGNPNTAPRCGAKSKRTGQPCQQPAMKASKTGRCRLHGGKSTGPKTPEGLERIRTARTRHGEFSQERKRFREELRCLTRSIKALAREMR